MRTTLQMPAVLFAQYDEKSSDAMTSSSALPSVQ
jgi:hypothetical protein